MEADHPKANPAGDEPLRNDAPSADPSSDSPAKPPARRHPDQPDAGDLVGRVLGDFAIERRLGSGGMGDVYLAQQRSLRRPVALKVLREEWTRDPNYRKRFEAEAMAVAPIHHPNIVAVIAIGKEDQLHYIAMEYVPGMNLREYVERKGPLECELGLTVLRKIASALDQAAQAGIVHRDIKPDNVLLTKKGDVKVADFGLARQVHRQDLALTQSGMTMGTPLYMSPEQLEGKPVDQRADLYSLGILAYFLFTGEPPYVGETAMAVAVHHLRSPIPLLSERRPDLPPELCRIVARLMAKDPLERYQTARELLRDLARRKEWPSEHSLTLLDGPAVTPRALRALATSNEKLSGAGGGGGGSGAGPGTVGPTEPLPTLTEARPSPWTRVRGIWTHGSRARRAAVVAASLALAGLAGAAVGLARRQPPLVGASPESVADTLRASARAVRRRKDGWIQLLQARSILPADQREAGYWSVLEYYKHEEEPAVEAASELMELYLPRGDFDSALVLADTLVACDDPKEKMFGFLFRGIVQSRRGQASDSNASFLEMIEQSRRVDLEPDQREWLAKHYFLALRNNARILGAQPNATMIDGFWKSFLARPGPGDERPGPPPRPP